MFAWRISKYNPRNRDSRGAYLIADEWTSYSEIGTTTDEKEFTYEEYKKIEDAYVSSIFLFMECNSIESLRITNLEKSLAWDSEDIYVSESMKNAFRYAENGLEINKDQISSLTRLVLREKLWCKLESKDMFVHFGWDYYMYVGSSHSCEKYLQKIQELGLFVEKYESPYLDESL